MHSACGAEHTCQACTWGARYKAASSGATPERTRSKKRRTMVSALIRLSFCCQRQQSYGRTIRPCGLDRYKAARGKQIVFTRLTMVTVDSFWIQDSVTNKNLLHCAPLLLVRRYPFDCSAVLNRLGGWPQASRRALMH